MHVHMHTGLHFQGIRCTPQFASIAHRQVCHRICVVHNSCSCVSPCAASPSDHYLQQVGGDSRGLQLGWTTLKRSGAAFQLKTRMHCLQLHGQIKDQVRSQVHVGITHECVHTLHPSPTAQRVLRASEG